MRRPVTFHRSRFVCVAGSISDGFPGDAGSIGAAQLPPATVDQEVADAQVAAKVGSEIILVSDIKAFMQQVVELKGGGEIKPDQLEEVFQESARPILKHLVEMKLVSNDAIHTIPAEGLKKIQANINDDFDKKTTA